MGVCASNVGSVYWPGVRVACTGAVEEGLLHRSYEEEGPHLRNTHWTAGGWVAG